MTLYVDASAFTRRYLGAEPSHLHCLEVMDDDEDWVTSRATLIETPRALHRARANAEVIAMFDADALDTAIVEIDQAVTAVARSVALETGVKSLDAVHIACALQLQSDSVDFLTYDQRQAAAAAQVGLRVITRA